MRADGERPMMDLSQTLRIQSGNHDHYAYVSWHPIHLNIQILWEVQMGHFRIYKSTPSNNLKPMVDPVQCGDAYILFVASASPSHRPNEYHAREARV